MDKALGYVALAAKAGKLVTGADNCVEALKRDKAKLLIAASDASDNALKRAEEMLFGRKTPLFCGIYTKYDLAHASGANGAVALAAICDDGLAAAFLKCARAKNAV